MNAISLSTPASAPHHLTAPAPRFEVPAPSDDQVADAERLRDAFTQFVGTTVFGQMLSSMRSTVGEPAYFHGGQAEKAFQGQLDQAIADEMTRSGASPFADNLFARQFPAAAATLEQAASADATLDQLAALPQR
ncbi:MAG: rod-binding protein [Planctomycetota bacterium]